MNTRYIIMFPVFNKRVNFALAIWCEPFDGGTGTEKNLYSEEQVDEYKKAFNSTPKIEVDLSNESDRIIYHNFINEVENKYHKAEFEKCRDNPVYFINNYTTYGIQNPIDKSRADAINEYIKNSIKQ